LSAGSHPSVPEPSIDEVTSDVLIALKESSKKEKSLPSLHHAPPKASVPNYVLAKAPVQMILPPCRKK
jgi:hypothetical protein